MWPDTVIKWVNLIQHNAAMMSALMPELLKGAIWANSSESSSHYFNKQIYQNGKVQIEEICSIAQSLLTH